MVNEIEQNSHEKKSVLPYLLLIGITGIGFNLYHKYERYYLGEPLIEKDVIIEEKPAYINAGRGTSRYSFKGSDYFCRFWLSQGALTVINDDENIEKEINAIVVGDTVKIKIRQVDEGKLQDWQAHPRVIELIKGDKVIISANKIQRQDQKWFYVNFGIPVFCLLIWAIIQIRNLIRKGNQPV